MQTIKNSLVFLIIALAAFALVGHLTLKATLFVFTVSFGFSVMPTKPVDDEEGTLLMATRTLLGFMTVLLTLLTL